MVGGMENKTYSLNDTGVKASQFGGLPEPGIW